MKFFLLALSLQIALSGQDRPSASRVMIVPIVGEIDYKNVALVKRAVRKIKAEKPDLVIFEIDTPGGRVDLMLAIGEEIMSINPIPNVAYVRPALGGEIMGGAISAGSYIAMSCKKIYMYPGTVIGAATPVLIDGGNAKPVEAKYVSVMREKFRSRAEQNGYSPNLAAAMVDREIELFEVVVDGKREYLTAGDIEKLRKAGKTLDVPTIPFDSKEQLLTLTARQVVETGMGKIAESRPAIYSDMKLVAPAEEQIEASWSEALVAILTSQIVSTILLVVGILGIWVELKTPGFGVAGVVGVLAIGLVLFGHHLAGLAQVMDIVLIVVGILLVIVELVFFPGMAVFAITGVLCILAGLVFAFQGFAIPDVKGAPWEVDVFLSAIGRVLVGFVGAGFGFLAIMRYLPNVPLFNRLVLQAEIGGVAPGPALAPGLVGRRGHAATPLRPGGKIEVDGDVHDVVAEGEFVAKGEPVEVLRIEGNRIVVGRLKR
jgi:membrane-bound serine protease (ClpP class)